MRYFWLLGLLLAVPAAGAEAPRFAETLAEPSFEGDEGPTPSAWRLSLEAGAQGKVSWTIEARTGRRALLIEKTNGLGYLMLSSTPPLAVKPGAPCDSGVSYRVKERGPNALVYFANQDLGADGTELYPVHFSPHYSWIPEFSAGDEWQDHSCPWTADARAAGTRLRFLVVGSPAVIVVDDFRFGAPAGSNVHKGVHNTNEKPYDEQVARANLAKRKPLPARVEVVNGRPMFFVGDRVRTALIHQGAYGHAAGSRYGGFGRAGIHLHTVTVEMGPISEDKRVAWKYPNGFDFKGVEEGILRAVAADPDACVILLVRCETPRQWGLDHPEDVWTDDDGQRWIVPKGDCHPGKKGLTLGDGEWFPGSYGSAAYREEMGRALAELGKFVRASDAGKIVAGVMIGGGNDGQFFDWCAWGSGHLDHSPGHRRGFQQWLREVYAGDVAALRKAWADPAVTFETAAVSDEKARTTAAPFLQLAGPQRRALDSNRYACIAPARLVKYFARVLKESIGRPLVSLVYYPDAIHDGGSNKYALTELLSGPDRMDSATAVQEYGQWRRPGGPGGPNASWGTHRLRGSVQICEIDYRTFRSYAAGEWGMEQLGAPDTVEGFRAQVLRDIGASATRGMGAWYYDMSGGWYDDPKLWAVVEETNRLMEWAHRPEAPSPVAEMAVFVDEEAGIRISRDALDLLFSNTNAQRRALNLSGVPYDLYFLDDIRHAKLPDYKAYVFLTSYTLTRGQADAIERRCRKPGKVTVFLGTPGLGSPDFTDVPALAQRLTGIRCELLPEGTVTTCVPAASCQDPIAAGLDGAFIHEGRTRKPMLVPADPEAVAFGTFVASGKPSHAIKRTSKGIGVCLVGGLTPQMVHNVARVAGIRTLGTPGQAIYVGSGVAVCHRAQPGPAQVTFARPVDLIAPDGKTILARGVREWKPEVAMHDTAVVFYR